MFSIVASRICIPSNPTTPKLKCTTYTFFLNSKLIYSIARSYLHWNVNRCLTHNSSPSRKSPTLTAVYLPSLLRAIFNPFSWLEQKALSNLWLYSSPTVLSNPSGNPCQLHLQIHAEYDTFLSLVQATIIFVQLTINNLLTLLALSPHPYYSE